MIITVKWSGKMQRALKTLSLIMASVLTGVGLEPEVNQYSKSETHKRWDRMDSDKDSLRYVFYALGLLLILPYVL